MGRKNMITKARAANSPQAEPKRNLAPLFPG